MNSLFGNSVKSSEDSAKLISELPAEFAINFEALQLVSETIVLPGEAKARVHGSGAL